MCHAIPIGNSVSPIGNSQKRPPEDGDVGSGIRQGIRRLRASITLSRALSRGDCRVVRNVVHIDEEVRHARSTRPWLTGGAELGRGVSKLIIRLNYNNLYLVYLYKCGVWSSANPGFCHSSHSDHIYYRIIIAQT